MTVTTAQVTTLLENVLFESASLAASNATVITATANVNPTTSTVSGLAAALAALPEAGIAEQVVRYYQGAFGRVPSPSEISFYVGIAEQGLTASQIAQGASGVSAGVWNTISNYFAASPEFQADFGITGTGITAANQAAVITGYYNNILGRAPSSAEITFYENALATGTASAATLLQYFTTSPEYQAAANATIQANLTAAGTTAVNTPTGTDPLASTAPIGGLPAAQIQKVALSTGLDTLTPTGTVTVSGIIGTTGGTADTFTNLDSIDGTGGNVTLSITDLSGAGTTPTGVTLTNIADLQWTSAGSVSLNTTDGSLGTVTGLKELDVLKSINATVIVGDGTAVNVTASGSATVTATDSAVTVNAGTTATVDGGSDVTVTAAGAVTIGAGTVPSGVITVTDSALGTATLAVDGGTNVSVTSTNAVAGGAIVIGAGSAPTGTVTVANNINLKGSGTGSTVAVTGGTVDTVTVNLTQGTVATVNTTTAGAVSVTGTDTTTSVSVTETKAVAAVAAVKAVAGVAASDVVTFTSLAAAATTTVGGLTFTNTSGSALTAAQVAAAFAGLTKGDLAGSSSLGTYSGSFTASYTGGAVSGSTVSFTEAGTPLGATAITTTGSATDAHTAGTAAAKAVTGVGGIADGAVFVTDGGTGSIATVTVNGFAGTSAINSKGLTTLSLANGGTALLAATVNVSDAAGGATALALTLNGDNLAALNLDKVAATYTSLAITTATADSVAPITAAAVTTLTVAGTNALDLSSSTFTALKTVAVSGSAGIKGDFSADSALTDINASGTSGANTVALDATKATYEGGTGNDTVTLGTAAPTKAISGGTGTDTIVLSVANAVTASNSTAFAADVTGFEALTVGAGTGAQTIHVDALGGFTQITTGGEATGGVLDFDGVASGTTLTLTSNAVTTGAYVLSNSAWTASAPGALVNIDLTAAGGLSNAGSVTAANVSAVNIVTSDTTKDVVAGTNTDVVTVVATSATSITASGNANLTLSVAGDTKLSTIDGHALTGGLTVTTAGTLAETVTGSATAANALTAHTGSIGDTLIGGAAADTIKANAGLDMLTGGGGNDVFLISTASTNVNTYATITDAHAGNVIELSGATSFAASKVTLGGTAVFQDYANAAVASAGAAHTASWFQFGGDTYIVENVAVAPTETAFVNGTDFIVKLAGIHDLTTAGFNTTTGAIVLH